MIVYIAKNIIFFCKKVDNKNPIVFRSIFIGICVARLIAVGQRNIFDVCCL